MHNVFPGESGREEGLNEHLNRKTSLCPHHPTPSATPSIRTVSRLLTRHTDRLSPSPRLSHAHHFREIFASIPHAGMFTDSRTPIACRIPERDSCVIDFR